MNRSSALICMHAATVLFGLSALFAKLVDTGVEMMVFGRALFAVVVLSGLMLAMRRMPWRQLRGRDAGMLVVTGVLLAIHWLAFFQAVKIGGVAVGTLGFACFPVFVALFESVFFKERLTRSEYLLFFLVTVGLILVTPAFTLRDNFTVGLLLGIVSGLVYAVIAMLNRLSATHLPGMQVCWWQYLVVMLLLLPLVPGEAVHVSARDWFWIGVLGIFCTALAYTLFISSLKVLRARSAAMVIALEPVYAIAADWLLYDVVPGWRMVCGGALIIGSVAWSARSHT